MSEAPVASVAIPVLNGEQTLGDLLAALKGQAGLRGGYEIIVVDNGSTDRTVEIAQSHGVRVLHQPVRGPAAARNMGLAAARGEILVYTDSDTVPTRRWLASLVAAFDDPDVTLATGPILGWQPQTGAQRYSSAMRGFSREWTAEHPLHPYAAGMNLAVRRSAAQAIGGWDQTMDSGEDVDFCFRIAKHYGKPIRFVDGAVLFHKHRSADEALWKQARWHGAGYAAAHQRHPDVIPWSAWNTFHIRVSMVVLYAAAPWVALGRAVGLFSAERMEFEWYHRRWARHFWRGFMEQLRSPQATRKGEKKPA